MTDSTALTLDLRKPLTEGEGADERRIAQLTLREPTAGEMRQAEVLKGSIPITIRVLSLVSGVKELTIRGMGARDLRQAGDYCAAFVVADVPAYDPASIPDVETFPLDAPLKAPTGDLVSIVLREPTAGQLDEYEHLDGWARRVRAIATVAGQPEFVIDQLPVRKALAMEAYLEGFFSDGPGAGSTS